MKVLIRETGKLMQITLRNPQTGENMVEDFIRCYDALDNGEFVYSEHVNVFVTDLETFNRWDAMLEAYEKLQERYHAAIEQFGESAVLEAMRGTIHDSGLQDEINAANAALDALAESHKQEDSP